MTVSKIEIYTTSHCPYCRRAKEILTGLGALYTEYDVDKDDKRYEEMQKRSNNRKTVPEIFIDDKHIGGCDDLEELFDSGKLQEMLKLDDPQKYNNHKDVIDVAIIGSGPAGLTAAIYASRANLSPVVFSGAQPGGQLTITTDVENYPGFKDGIMGPELMQNFQSQAERFGTKFISGQVDSVNFKIDPFEIEIERNIYHARAVIIATGAEAQLPELSRLGDLMGHGVSACATCDGFFFKNQDIGVVGGGDSALEEANFLTKFASKVYIIHRRDALRASKIMQDRANKNTKIEFVWNSVVTELKGDDKLTGVRLKDVKTSKTRILPVTGLFFAIGHIPNTLIFKEQIDLDAKGYVVLHKNTQTNIPGVFAAGDVSDFRYRQAITAAGSGCMAAIDAERFLESS